MQSALHGRGGAEPSRRVPSTQRRKGCLAEPLVTTGGGDEAENLLANARFHFMPCVS